MRQNEVVVDSWSALQERLFEDAWNAAIGRYRSPFAFRGLSDARYELRTTLMRLGGAFARMETHLLRNFRKYAHGEVLEGDSVWHWLSRAQHHGLPTRLLDWTYSPFVAMHFATVNINRFDRDGAIWAVNYHKVHEQLPARLREALEAEGSDVFTVEMLSHVATTLHDYAGLAEEPFLVFLEPPSMDERIINQYALFSVISDPCVGLESWLHRRPDLWRKIVIPASLKWEVRDKLDQANVTERVLFPGLDGLSSWLKRHYSPPAASASRDEAGDSSGRGRPDEGPSDAPPPVW